MRVLLENGANVNVLLENGDTPLNGAVYTGRARKLAVLLLDRGAEIDLPDNKGRTPLYWAGVRGDCDMIRFLLSRGADLDARDNDGRNAENFARSNDYPEAAVLLADVRLAGGWDAYLRYPRFKLLALRVLCARGRASTDDALLRRLFPWHASAADDDADADAERPSLVARAPHASQLPKEVFWLVLKFWRSSRDFHE